MLTIAAWKWATKFSALHVNVARLAYARHLQLDHEFVCVTDDPAGLDGDIRVVPMPEAFSDTPRCRRRMQQYARDFAEQLGTRILTTDLDIVIVGDLTAILNRPEPVVGWRVGHAGVYSGSFVLADAGALDGAWQRYRDDPTGYPLEAAPRGVGSDQAMLNHFLKTQPPIGTWTEADGFVTYYGRGYERHEHLGVGPNRRELPAGARLVVLGSEDLEVLNDDRYQFVRDHWMPLAEEVMASHVV